MAHWFDHCLLRLPWVALVLVSVLEPSHTLVLLHAHVCMTVSPCAVAGPQYKVETQV